MRFGTRVAPGKTISNVLRCLVPLIAFAATCVASPELTLKTTTEAAEKGVHFQMWIEIEAKENTRQILISPIAPDGFTIEPLGRTETETKEHITTIDELSAGSTVAIPFRVTPPDLWGRPKGGAKESRYSTREPKEFRFNISYTIDKDSSPTRESRVLSKTLPYTTALGIYLAAGMFGVLLGHIVKITSQDREKIIGSFGAQDRIWRRLLTIGGHLFGVRITALVTLIVVGFGALLVMGKDGLPVSSWHQAIALGVGLGVLADEQVLAKIKG